MKTRTLLLAFCLFIIAGVPRIITLDAHWASDESTWLYRSAGFISLVKQGKFSETLIAHHPGVMTMWLGGLRMLSKRTHTWLSQKDLALARWFIGIALSAGLAVAWFLLYRLLEFWPATFAGAFLAVNPFLLAQTRRVHTDALAATFILLTVLSFLLFSATPTETERRQKRGYLIFAGVAFGFACLSKSYSLILLPWVPLCLWLFRPHNLPWREFLYSSSTTGILFLNCSLLTVFGVWPVFWHPIALLLGACLLGVTAFLPHALKQGRHANLFLGCAAFVLISCTGYAVKTLWIVLDKVGWALTTAHEIDHFFLGKIVADPGWLFYLFTLSIKSTPFILPLAISAIFVFWKQRLLQNGSRHFKIAMALSAAAVLFIVCLSLTSKKFSRYLLPVFPMLDVLAGIGLFYIMKWIGKHGIKKASLLRGGQTACVTLIFVLTSLPVFLLHPYYGTYYNLVWKVSDIAKIITVNDTSGLDIAAAHLNKKPDPTRISVQASHLGSEFLRYYFVGTVYRADKNRIEGTEQLRHADYEVVYIRDLQIGRVPQTGTRNGELERVITLNGIDLVWIYRIPPPEE